MSKTADVIKMSFREAYNLVSKQAVRWFPGHMGKSIKQMQKKVRSVDCVIEVHDARIPFSGRNPEFRQTIAGTDVKPHILVLNKKDLLEIREQRKVMKQLQQRENVNQVVFTNSKDPTCAGIRRLLPLAHELVLSTDRYNRNGVKDINVMIFGVPNVGKSSLLNVLRNRHLHKKAATKVGAIAGVTRSVLERIKISEDPLMYMIDTPGIMEPRIEDNEMGMKLALVGCVPDHLIGEELIADYLLYQLNSQRRFEYVALMGLQTPTDNIAEALLAFANKLGVQRKVKRLDGQLLLMPDITVAARRFIKHFRRGDFGGINLDNVSDEM